jgi:hypothetical protein
MNDETAIALIEEQADTSIRRDWHNDRWYFSVIDVIGVMTDSGRPRKYWSDLKRSLAEDEGFSELLSRIQPLKMQSPDGKYYQTDAADSATLERLKRYIPATAPWRTKPRNRPPSIVYAIGPGDGAMVKIGTTVDLPTRLRELQRGSPVPLTVLWKTAGNIRLERQLHSLFASRRAYGEWFDFSNTAAVVELENAIKECIA